MPKRHGRRQVSEPTNSGISLFTFMICRVNGFQALLMGILWVSVQGGWSFPGWSKPSPILLTVGSMDPTVGLLQSQACATHLVQATTSGLRSLPHLTPHAPPLLWLLPLL